MNIKLFVIPLVLIMIVATTSVFMSNDNYSYYDAYDWSGLDPAQGLPGITGWVVKFPSYSRQEYLMMEPELQIRPEDMIDRFSYSNDPYLGDISNWIVHNHDRWFIVTDEDDLRWGIITSKYLNLSGGRLGEYALVKNGTYGDFIFNATVRIADNMDRNPSCDYDVIFGYQSPVNYYYMMFSSNEKNTDLFKIQNGERYYVAQTDTFPVPDKKYHNISIERYGSRIEIYFDGEKILGTRDSTFGAGKIGIGSFNDMSLWDDIEIISLGEYSKADTDLNRCVDILELIGLIYRLKSNPEDVQISDIIDFWIAGINC